MPLALRDEYVRLAAGEVFSDPAASLSPSAQGHQTYQAYAIAEGVAQ